jgi:hypothetical protein
VVVYTTTTAFNLGLLEHSRLRTKRKQIGFHRDNKVIITTQYTGILLQLYPSFVDNPYQILHYTDPIDISNNSILNESTRRHLVIYFDTLVPLYILLFDNQHQILRYTTKTLISNNSI